MNLSEYIPTDNLYKFLAIFGLIIFALSFIYPRKALNEFYLQRLELYGQVKIIKLQTDNLEEKTKELTFPSKETFEKREEYSKDAFALKLKSQELENTNAKISYLVKQYQGYLRYSYRGMIVGMVMMFLGFTLWYFKLQVYQDRIIKKEANKH